MAKKRFFYKKFRKTLYETVSDSGNSVLRYRGHDDKEHYVASSEAPGGTPMPSGGGMTEVTWQELKDLRDNSQLTPGSLYRITDYNCTTTQENTQSAGHQFDIVLLALSENKLAEEGWAMMNESNIYDVTFADGVTKKCYINNYDDETYSVIIVTSLLGTTELKTEVIINKEDKTAICHDDSIALVEEGLTYNYFQNSNLSAWKVWYCLDNDKSRFAWADNSVDEGTPASIVIHYPNNTDPIFIRDLQGDVVVDNVNYYKWVRKDREDDDCYTLSETPNAGDISYEYNDPIMEADLPIKEFVPPTEGTGLPNGRGVIYRLIDEWNNDVAYDFKNIQFIRPMTGGEYDPKGENTWVYTFSLNNGGTIVDGSSGGVDNTSYYCNKITMVFELYSNVFFSATSDSFISSGCDGLTIDGGGFPVTCYNCYETFIKVTEEEGSAIYINNKKVLTES